MRGSLSLTWFGARTRGTRTFLAEYLQLELQYRVGWLDLERDRLTSEGLDEDLHIQCASERQP